MSQHVGNTKFGHSRSHIRVGTATDIVDDIYTIVAHYAPRHLRAKCVNAHDGLRQRPAQSIEGHRQARELLVGRRSCGAGTCTDGADIENRGTLVEQLPGTRHQGGRAFGHRRAAALEEGVGRGIQYAHDDGLLEF